MRWGCWHTPRLEAQLRRSWNFLTRNRKAVRRAKKNNLDTYREYEKEHIKESATLEAEIGNGDEKVQEFTAHAQEQRARSEKCRAEMQEAETIGAGIKENMKASKQEHDEDTSIKNKDRVELATAVNALERAITVLKAQPSGGAAFLQQDTSKMEAVVAAVAAVVHAAGSVKSPAAQKVTEMLQLNQPQASVQNYTSKTGGIIEKVGELLEEAENKLSELDSLIMKARHAFEVTQQAFQAAFNTEGDRRTQGKKCMEDATAQAGEADTKLAGATSKFEADSRELSEAKQEYRGKTKEHNEAQERLTKEIAALDSGIQKLSTFVAAGFLQISKKAGKGHDQRARAASFLRKLGHELKSFGLLQAAVSVSSRTEKFTKVVQLITDMIDRMEKKMQAAQDAEEKCKTELAKLKKDVAISANIFAKTDARVTKMTSDIANIETEVGQAQSDLKETREASADSEQLRIKEATNHKAEQEELNKAIEVLSSVLEDIRDVVGELVVTILQDAIDSSKAEKEESDNAERKSKNMHEKVQHARQVAMAKNEMQIQSQKKELQSLAVRLNDLNSDRSDAQSNSQSAKELQGETVAKCTQKVQSHEEKMAAMQREIEGLKEAVAILTTGGEE